jgi:glycosyltransferase involved in cell wall biosynthesis
MRVSVVIPCYNAEPFLGEAIESVLRQTVPPGEVIVIDDGSIDRSVAVAQSFGAAVRVIQHANGGPSLARNRGIEEARGEWIAFLDADDLWLPEKMEKQLALLEGQEEVACVHTHYYCFGALTCTPPISDAQRRGEYSIRSLIFDQFVFPSSALVRRDSPIRFPGWAWDAEDMIYFLDTARFGAFRFLPEPLVGYRKHKAQRTRAVDHAFCHHQSVMRWLRNSACHLPAATRAEIEETYMSSFLRRIQLAFWERDWTKYWALRSYASQFPGKHLDAKILHEFVFPPAVYRVRDWFDSARARAGNWFAKPDEHSAPASGLHVAVK